MQDKDEDGIERDVCDGADERGRHACGRVSLCGDVLIEPDGGDGEERSCCVYEQIFSCVGIGAVACAERVQQGTLKDEHGRRDQDREGDEGKQCVDEDLLRPAPPLFAEGHGKQGRAACADEKGKGGNEGGDGGAHAHGGERGIADPFDVAYVHSVHDGV